MLKNYFKIAIAVLKRRKFFTFISLFGISITLAILMVTTSFVDHMTGARYPEFKRERSLYVHSFKSSSKKGYINGGEPSFYFLNNYVLKLKTPEMVAICSSPASSNAYVNNKKLKLDIMFTNRAFWDVMEFEFIEGKPYTQQQILNGEFVSVINEDTRDAYFGQGVKAVGKYIESDNIQYRVIGVVKTVPITRMFSSSDLYVPYTLPKSGIETKGYMGNYMCVLLAKQKSDLTKIKEEYNQMMAKLPLADPKEWDTQESYADSYVGSFIRRSSGPGSKLGTIYFVIGAIVFVFMLLPTINLVNINITRIMERSSEIGVRKAFGASSGTLVVQFIVENMILTFLGGLLGLVFAAIVITIINTSGWIPNADLSLNFGVLTISFLLCVLFGFISGVYPALRMSRLQIVSALKA
jgi:putative ABC transport system permease protein